MTRWFHAHGVRKVYLAGATRRGALAHTGEIATGAVCEGKQGDRALPSCGFSAWGGSDTRGETC